MKARHLAPVALPARGRNNPDKSSGRGGGLWQYIALDVHKRYSWARIEDAQGHVRREERVEHQRGAIQGFLQSQAAGTPVAVEAVGNWYWVVDEIEAAGCVPQLVQARKAKLRMGQINKTDKLAVRGLNRLQRSGTLPTGGIALGAVRDARELPRTRMVLARQRTQLKNRIWATLQKYGLAVTGGSDSFGREGRRRLEALLPQVPEQTRYSVTLLLQEVDGVQARRTAIEKRMRTVFGPTREDAWLQTVPGIGAILAVVLATEIGDITRFGRAEQLASYAGTTPRVAASGGKVRYGPVRSDVNHDLKGAYGEAATAAVLNAARCHYTHVQQLDERLRAKPGHGKALVAEASFWVLTKGEPYRAPHSSSPG